MKKILLMLMMALMFWNVSVGQVVKSVAGVEFGTDRSSAMEQLRDRFGYDYDVNGERATFNNVTLGRTNYDEAEFFFKGGKFVAACFAKRFSISNVASAKKMREEIFNEYKEKYTHFGDCIIDGFKCYTLGYSMYYDKIWPIQIRVANSENGGIYGTLVEYYIDKYFNNDEI